MGLLLIPFNYLMFSSVTLIPKIIYLIIILLILYIISYNFNKFFFYHKLKDNHKDLIFNIRKAVVNNICYLFMGLFMFLILYQGLTNTLNNECNEYILTEYHDCIKNSDGVMDCTNNINPELNTNLYIDYKQIEVDLNDER